MFYQQIPVDGSIANDLASNHWAMLRCSQHLPLFVSAQIQVSLCAFVGISWSYCILITFHYSQQKTDSKRWLEKCGEQREREKLQSQ